MRPVGETTELQSFGPMEVLLVRRGTATGEDMFTLLVRWLLLPIDAALLMLAVPLAHTVLGSPPVHPGYWPCLALLFLFDRVAARILRPVLPRASA